MSRAFREFFSGLRDYPRALQLVRREHLWPWLILPGLVSVAYFPAIIVASLFLVDDAESYLRAHWLPAFLQQPLFSWLITVALWLACLYAGFIFFRNIIMILYAPILGWLSARVEEKAEGSPLNVPPARFLPTALRAIAMSLSSLGLSLLCLLLGILLLLVPILGGLLMPVLLAVSQMFLAGHGFMDPTFERHGYGVARSIGLARRNRWRTLGCGGGFLLLTAIPLAGWFLAPSIGLVAGTLAALELEARDNSRGA
jgi:uncharacterized protein involved in cysteine biosynthesis